MPTDGPAITLAGTPTSRPMPSRTWVCYAWVTMSAINGDMNCSMVATLRLAACAVDIDMITKADNAKSRNRELSVFSRPAPRTADPPPLVQSIWKEATFGAQKFTFLV